MLHFMLSEYCYTLSYIFLSKCKQTQEDTVRMSVTGKAPVVITISKAPVMFIYL